MSGRTQNRPGGWEKPAPRRQRHRGLTSVSAAGEWKEQGRETSVCSSRTLQVRAWVSLPF